MVLVAVELRGKSIGKIHFEVIDSDKSKEIIRFISENISNGSHIITDKNNNFFMLGEKKVIHMKPRLRMKFLLMLIKYLPHLKVG
jgi:hypothetical protein